MRTPQTFARTDAWESGSQQSWSRQQSWNQSNWQQSIASQTTYGQSEPSVALEGGGTELVSTNGTFPSGAPVFRLAGYGHGTAQIGIVGGSYQAGGQTLTLHQGVPVTLQNTTDGTQYKLELLSTP